MERADAGSVTPEMDLPKRQYRADDPRLTSRIEEAVRAKP